MEESRSFGYLCPHCKKPVLAQRTRFALSAAAVRIECACEKSELRAETDGLRFRLWVPCGLCGETHQAELSNEAMLDGRGVGLACPKTKQLCCYIGEQTQVEQALQELERAANEAVWADFAPHIWYPEPDELAHLPYRSKKALTGAVRLVQFGDIDLCACCGTHVAHTGEIGLIKLFSTTHFRGGSRIEMACGGRALAMLNALCAQNRDISVRLSAKPVQTAAAVARLASERTEAQQRAAALEDRLFALLAQDGQTLRFEPPMPPESVRRLADAMVRANGARCAVFAGQDGAWHYAMADRDGDLRGLTKRLNAALQGRGGGKPGFVQGSLAASRTDIEAFFTAESCSMPDPA